MNAHRGGAVRSTDVSRELPPEQTVVHLSRYAGALDVELYANVTNICHIVSGGVFLCIDTHSRTCHVCLCSANDWFILCADYSL